MPKTSEMLRENQNILNARAGDRFQISVAIICYIYCCSLSFQNITEVDTYM